MRDPEVSIVVPVFNEEESLPVLAAEIGEAMLAAQRSYEVVFVDDGSTDGSLAVLKELAARDGRIRVLHLPSNLGQSAALAVGFRTAGGRVIVTLDADLQNDPADIPRLLEELEGSDVVSGIRVDRQDPWLRRVSSRVANRVRGWVLEDSITDVGCSLKAYRAEFLRGIPTFHGMHRFLPALVRMEGARITEIAVHHRRRRHGRSKYNIRGRLPRVVVDLVAVWWMQRRWIARRRVEKAEVCPCERSDRRAPGSSSR